MPKLTLYLSLAAILLSSTAVRYAGDFEELGSSARAIGMGGAVVALVTGPSAVYYNPALVGAERRPGAFFLHSEDFAGLLQHNYIALAVPQDLQSLGFAILHNGVPGIKLTALPDSSQPPGQNNRPYVDRVVNANQFVGYVSYARRLSPVAAVGGNAKLIYQALGAGSAFGAGLDLGLALTPGAGINIGLRLRNASTSPLFWDTGAREKVLPRGAIGVGKTFRLGRDVLRLALEAEILPDDLELEASMGAEYGFRDVLFGRIGVHRGNLTFGLGARYRRVYLDYGYAAGYAPGAAELGSAQQLSGGVEF